MPKVVATVIALIAAGLLAMSLTACVPRTPEASAREIAEKWAAASDRGDEDSAQGLACSGAMLGGVNGDGPDVEARTIEVEAVGDGEFNVVVTEIYSDYPDIESNLRVETTDDLCIKWVR